MIKKKAWIVFKLLWSFRGRVYLDLQRRVVDVVLGRIAPGKGGVSELDGVGRFAVSPADRVRIQLGGEQQPVDPLDGHHALDDGNDAEGKKEQRTAKDAGKKRKYFQRSE